MRLIKEILEKDVFASGSLKSGIKYSVRKAARAILFKDNKIAILFVSKKNYHKLPGGGVEEGEDVKKALFREILEETGCTSKIDKELGITIEYKDKVKILQISYIYFATVVRESRQFNFTEKEKSQGFILEWYSLSQIKNIFSKDVPKDYHGKFISIRDKAIIEHAIQSSKN